MVEPTKVCKECGQRKPWSAYYPARKWEDGTMRNPRWACKKCESQVVAERERKRRQERPTDARRAARNRYHKKKHDPEWMDTRRAYGREMADKRRRARGVPEGTKRGPMVAQGSAPRDTVPAESFAEWLRHVMARDGLTINGLADRVGVGERVLRRLVNGEQDQVELSTVERALTADGGATLRDVYPEAYAEAA